MNRLYQIVKPGIPNFDWVKNYQRKFLSGDILAGVTVGVMLIPQCMAYALLAGLPPQYGLYASLLPMLFYLTWGTSPYLSVAPVAITSIIVGTTLAEIAGPDIGLFITLASMLAFMEGTLQMIMGTARLGFIVNFISHPVLSGYISAAALSIILSQIGTLLGISLTSSQKPYMVVSEVLAKLNQINGFSFTISLLSLTLLILGKKQLGRFLKKLGSSSYVYSLLPKAMPLIIVISGIVLTHSFKLNEKFGLAIVGHLPTGFPDLKNPLQELGYLVVLLPIALHLSLLSFLESFSVGKALAFKDSKLLGANKEFFALGAANMASSFSGGYSVSGSLSRSTVNYQSGANTKLAGLITVLMVAVTVLFLMPELYYLPRPILSAVIVTAVASLIDFRYFVKLFKLNRTDALAFTITFLSVFVFGIKWGLIIGIFASMVFYVWVTSKPHIAVIGRIGRSEHFRNILRHEVTTHPHTLTIRIDENLTFANSKFIEQQVNKLIEEKKAMDHVANIENFVLVTSNINYIDISALETLEGLFARLENQGIAVYMAEVKGPVMDFLKAAGFAQRFGEERIFLSTHLAIKHLTEKRAADTFSI